MEFITIIQRAGFDTYKDLIRWSKKQLNLRTIKDRKDAIYQKEMVTLFMHHFDFEQNEAVKLYDALVGMGLLEEHYGWYSENYLCTTFNV